MLSIDLCEKARGKGQAVLKTARQKVDLCSSLVQLLALSGTDCAQFRTELLALARGFRDERCDGCLNLTRHGHLLVGDLSLAAVDEATRVADIRLLLLHLV